MADAEASTRKVFIVHGYTAHARSHWFPWLKSELENLGVATESLSMPFSTRPVAADWLRHLQEKIASPDEQTYIVAHSLGCIAVLNYLATLPAEARIGGLVCVAGFAEPLPNLPELDSFNQLRPPFPKIRATSPKRAVILSENDQIVDPGLTEDLARDLGVPPLRIAFGGHFLGSEGFTELPPVLTTLRSWIGV